MATLRSPDEEPLPLDEPLPLEPTAPSGGGGILSPGGSGQSPVERNPSTPPTPGNRVEVPAQPQEPQLAGRSAPLASPPSVTQRVPRITPPTPESLVFPSGGGGRGLFGNSGGMFGGGLSLGDQGQQASDPSSLIQALLKLSGQQG